MRIAFISWRDLAHPQAGGSELVIDRLLVSLQARGHDVVLLCGDPVGPHPYPVVGLGGTYAQYLRAPWRLRRRVGPVDAIVDVSNGLPFFSPLWQRQPVVCFVHHVHRDQWRHRFPRPVAAVAWRAERDLVPRVYRHSVFTAVSASTAAALTQEVGVPAEQVRIIALGTDPVVERGAESPEPLWLSLGRLVPHKRVPLILQVWERVRDVVGGRLVIAGDGPERGMVERLAGPGVDVLGAITDEEKTRLLRTAWLLVHAAQHEGWGVVITEAAAHGTPTLGFDVPGVRDAVVDGVTGLLVHTPDELARRWIELAADADLRQRLGRAAATRASQRTWASTAEDMERAIADAMERRRVTAAR